jgi:hypothetical protein
MKSLNIFILSVISLLACGITHANDHDYHLGFRIAPRVSTLGGGLEVAKGLTPWFGLRGGINYFTYDYNGKESDIEYDLNLELKSFGLFADVHPFKQAFRISAGFLINGNEFSGRGKITGTSFEIGDRTYNSNEIKSLGFDLSYNTFAPYLGIGFDTTFGDDDRWGFVFDLGILFSGSPEASFSYDDSGLQTSAERQTLRKEVEKEKKEIQDSLDDFEFWPVVSAGLVYQF